MHLWIYEVWVDGMGNGQVEGEMVRVEGLASVAEGCSE